MLIITSARRAKAWYRSRIQGVGSRRGPNLLVFKGDGCSKILHEIIEWRSTELNIIGT